MLHRRRFTYTVMSVSLLRGFFNANVIETFMTFDSLIAGYENGPIERHKRVVGVSVKQTRTKPIDEQTRLGSEPNLPLTA